MDQSARSEFAILHLDASDEGSKFSVEVMSFEIEEALSQPFTCEVYFLSASPSLPFDDIVGRGAALSLHTGHVGDRIWAGVVTEFELLHSEEHTGSPGGIISEAMAAAGIGGPNYKGRSRYRLTIRPDFYRLTLRKNSRIFQGVNAVTIVKEVLKDWHIEVDEKLSKVGEHPKFDFKVQYQETDFDFVSRVLEDAGISYWLQPSSKIPTTEKKKGNEVTKIILLDDPANEPAKYDGKNNVLPYLGDGPDKHHDMGPHMWMLSAKQRPKPLKRTIRDRDFRIAPHVDIDGMHMGQLQGRPAIEGSYETFEYQPGAFWFSSDQHQGDADAKYAPRTNEQQKVLLAERRNLAGYAGRTIITFKTNAMDIEPATTLKIGKKEFGYDHNHPHPAFSSERKLLVVGRKISGQASGSGYSSDLTAVYADTKFKPELTVPKPRVYGVQSAVVVGPKGQEIHVDEFGRVRVQFPWDRYHKFDDDSSCWIRVSQAWAGGGFGMINHPRVGHEVLVGFYEGDPDQPVIVGRVYNATTRPPYSPANGPNATKSGIKTDSSPHHGGSAGYNEMSFQDARGSELIHVQAQKDLTFVVNNHQGHDVGSSLSYKVGSSESHDIGQSLTIKIGMSESHEMGQSFDVKVGVPGMSTELKMDPSSITLSTGKASIVIKDDSIFLNATGEIHVHSTKTLELSTPADVNVDAKLMTVDTEDQLLLNCDSAKIHKAEAAPAGFAMPPAGPAHGGQNPAPYIPASQPVAPVQPGPLEHVNVGEDLEQKAKDVVNKAKDGATELGPLAQVGQVAGAAQQATDAVAKVADAAKAIDPAVAEAAKLGLPKFAADIPGMTQILRGLHGADMTMEALTKDIGAFVKSTGDAATDWAKVVVAHIPEPVQDLLSSKLGKSFMNSAVTGLLKSHGLPTSMEDVGTMAVNKMVKAVGYDGNNKLSKALFGGMVDDFKKDVTTALGKTTVNDMITNVFGGTTAPKAAAGAAKTAATGAAQTAASGAAQAAASGTTQTAASGAVQEPPRVTPPKVGPEGTGGG